MKKLCVFAVLLISASLYGQSSWQGNADVSKFGELPSVGYFGACDDFPRDTMVKVTNLTNGKTVVVSIIGDLSNEPGLFLLLSPQAGEALGIKSGQVQVAVEVDRSNIDRQSFLYRDESTNPDPEINPEAAAKEPLSGEDVVSEEEFVPLTDDLASTAEIEEAPEVVEEESEEIEQEVLPEESPDTEPLLLPQLAEESSEPLQVSGTFPQQEAELGKLEQEQKEAPLDKVLALPGREDPFYALPEEEVLPTEEEVNQLLVELDTPEVLETEGDPLETQEEDPEETPEVSFLPELPPVPVEEEVEEDPLVPEITPIAELPPLPEEEEAPVEFPISDPEEVIITLETGDLRPPQEEPIEEEEDTSSGAEPDVGESPEEGPQLPPVEEPVDYKLVTLNKLDPRKNYIQIGAYRRDINIEKQINDLKSLVPVVILKKPEEPHLLRLVAGPLPEDQIGILFYLVKDRGFRDSFIIRRKE